MLATADTTYIAVQGPEAVFRLTRTVDAPVAYKIKSTVPNNVKIRPATGILESAQPFDISLTFTDFPGKGKLQVQFSTDDGAADKLLIVMEEATTATPPEDEGQTQPTAPPAVTTAAPASTADPNPAAAPPPNSNPSTGEEAPEGRSAASRAAARFDIRVFISDFIATAATSSRAYALTWKRGNASGATSIVRGSGGRVDFANEVISIPRCKTSFKEDGSIARRLLQLTVLHGAITEDAETDRETLPTLEGMVEWGSVKVDTSCCVSGRRDAELPVKSTNGAGTLMVALEMKEELDEAATDAPPAVVSTALPEASSTPTEKPLAGEATTATNGGDVDDGDVDVDDEYQPPSTKRTPLAPRRRDKVEVPDMPTFNFGAISKSLSAAPTGSPLLGSANPLSAMSVLPAESQSNVFVCVRVRPLLRRIESGDVGWKMGPDGKSLVATAAETGALYEYDHVIAPSATNKDVYALVGPRFVDGVVSGINGTIFMYGQTASGKTHTMFGEETERGVTQLTIENIFTKVNDTLKEHSANGATAKATVSVGYFEVYNEILNDLLDISKQNLPVRATKDGGFSPDVTYRSVPDAAAALAVLREGSENKKMGQSVLNDRSSRSHTIFRVRVRLMIDQGAGQKRMLSAELNLVDLAGSESLSDHGDEANKKETSHINLSLSFLKKVIGELAHKSSFVSYRNSVLTKVLKQALGGNSRTTVICCITPAAEHYRDSRNTLAFGTTARSVVLTARANASDSGAAAAVNREELRKLQAQLLAMQSAIAAYQGIEQDYNDALAENEQLAMEVDRLDALVTKLRRQYKRQLASRSQANLLHKEESAAPASNAAGGEVDGAAHQDQEQDGGEAAAGSTAEPESSSHYAAVSADGGEPQPATDQADAQPQVEQQTLEDELDAIWAEVDAHDEQVTQQHSTHVDPADIAMLDPDEGQPAAEGADAGEEFEDVELDAPTPAPSRDLLKMAPKSRPAGKSAHLSETIILRRELHKLRLEYHEAMLKKNAELQQLAESNAEAAKEQAAAAVTVTSSVAEEIPEFNSKDERVATLLDEIEVFLHYGTKIERIVEKKGKYELALEHLYLSRSTPGTNNNVASLCVCGLDPVQGNRDRTKAVLDIAVKEIKRVELGQDSEAFIKLLAHHQKMLDLARTADSGADKSDATREELAKWEGKIADLYRKARYSFTVIAKRKRVIDVVCQTDADFEAWILGLNRLLQSSAEWPKPMDVSQKPGVGELDKEEEDFCSTMHIYPKEYVRARAALFGPGPRLITLFDLRSTTGLDLYHSQRLFYFARCKGWIDQANIYYVTTKATAAAQQDDTFAEVGQDSEFVDDSTTVA